MLAHAGSRCYHGPAHHVCDRVCVKCVWGGRLLTSWVRAVHWLLRGCPAQGQGGRREVRVAIGACLTCVRGLGARRGGRWHLTIREHGRCILVGGAQRQGMLLLDSALHVLHVVHRTAPQPQVLYLLWRAVCGAEGAYLVFALLTGRATAACASALSLACCRAFRLAYVVLCYVCVQLCRLYLDKR